MKKSAFNILLFIGFYIFLMEGFYIYVGLTTPGGKLDSAFLTNYLNIPWWLTVFVTKISAFLLQASGYSVHQANPANITIAGSRGVTVAWGCLGIGAMSLWLAFIAAHRRFSLHKKIKWISAGIAIIFLVNIGRIMMISLSSHYHWQYIRSFDAHSSFNMLTYGIILVMMFVFARRYKKWEALKASSPL